MNGWLARNVAVYAFAQVQHFSRCERMQRKIETSPLGSNPKFAAVKTNACFPRKSCP
ncbi:hypothetical protein [Sulfitobacter mediterraneus]|uniref:hypothetical protein n=1 Tax=Sulfitobacter mediterraneus TaxID=83219 RepID=UPI001B880B99|nr:hypothetical protein [Sulfitobacter mediterraneus]